MREVVPYRDFPKEIAISIYSWLLKISVSKGQIDKKLKAYDKSNETDFMFIWDSVRNNVRKEFYYFRLRKSVLAFIKKDCKWCIHTGKCRSGKCLLNFKTSLPRNAKLFNVDVNEVQFIVNNLTKKDWKNLVKFFNSKVAFLYTFKEEEEYHPLIFDRIFWYLTNSGHYDKKALIGEKILGAYGINKDDIKQELYNSTWALIKRYDYLPIKKIMLIIAKSLGNELVNQERSVISPKKFFLFGKNAIQPTKISEDDDSPFNYMWETVALSDNDPETEFMTEERRKLLEKFKDIKGSLNSVEKMFYSIVSFGEPIEEFLTYLKQQKLINSARAWASFYKKADPTDLSKCANGFFGYEVSESIKQKLEGQINSMQGDQTMAKVTVSVPKATCVLCKYWVSWLPKKRIPKDCNPQFPGCPVHVYNLVCEFPIKAAAIQLRKFIDAGDNDAVQKFIETAPNPAEIFKRAMSLTPEEIEEAAAAAAEEDIEDEDEVNLEDMDRIELLDFIIENKFDIPGFNKMDDEDLREAIAALYSSSLEEEDNNDNSTIAIRSSKLIGDVNDDESNDEDDEDITSKIMQEIEPVEKAKKH